MENLDVFDLRRMFLGDAPPLFLVEIIVRSALMYGYALLMLRLIGRRSMGQLSAFDFAIVIALGSAVGDPMFYPEVPLLHGMVVITVIVAMERGLAELVQRSEKADTVISGKPILLVEDGRLIPSSERENSLSREELFSILREHKVQQLGEVRRAYLEATGKVSVFLYDEGGGQPGLPILPPWELEAPETYLAREPVPAGGHYACLNCGAPVPFAPREVLTFCPQCEGERWTAAVLDPLAG